MELLVQDLDHPAGFRRALLPLDSGVDVLGALSKDHDVEAFRMGDGAWDPWDPVDRPDVGVEVEHLPQPHIQRAEASTDRRGQRPLEPDDELPDRGEGGLREHVAVLEHRSLPAGAGLPADWPTAPEGGPDRPADPAPGRPHDVRANAVAPVHRDDGAFGAAQPPPVNRVL